MVTQVVCLRLQVALLDFGASRGFEKSFTDNYIEVRNNKLNIEVDCCHGDKQYCVMMHFLTIIRTKIWFILIVIVI